MKKDNWERESCALKKRMNNIALKKWFDRNVVRTEIKGK